MSDLPISSLATLTTYSTTDQLEILDVSDSTFAGTGTNKKVTVQNLLVMAGLAVPVGVPSGGTGLGTLTAHGVMLGEGTSIPGFATIGTAGRVLTDNGSGADPTFQQPATKSVVFTAMSGVYTLTTAFANCGCAITLPVAGTYLILGGCRAYVAFSGTSTTADGANVSLQLYDSTAAAVVPSSAVLAINAYCFAPSSQQYFFQSIPIGPILYTVTVPSVINLQALYAVHGSAVISDCRFFNDASGITSLTGLRVY